jgi:hypothetical protein
VVALLQAARAMAEAAIRAANLIFMRKLQKGKWVFVLIRIQVRIQKTATGNPVTALSVQSSLTDN